MSQRDRSVVNDIQTSGVCLQRFVEGILEVAVRNCARNCNQPQVCPVTALYSSLCRDVEAGDLIRSGGLAEGQDVWLQKPDQLNRL